MAYFVSEEMKGIQFKTVACQNLTDETLVQCKSLFDGHYGVWGEGSAREGKRIRFPSSLYQTYRELENAYVALAIFEGNIIGQAFYLKTGIDDEKRIAWVLQLVVHEDFRKRGIAKTLLYSIWGFSDDYAWGLATSNALTVKTLEKATLRKVRTKEMQKHEREIIMLKEKIPFAKESETIIQDDLSVLNSSFPVDRSIIEKNLQLYDGEWELGELPQGYEWLAFTFQDQEYQMSLEDYDKLFENSEKIVNDAYNRMNLSNQPWNRHQKKEVGFILEKLSGSDIHKVYDFGCGNGRHALEFASRGYQALGIDYSERNIQAAKNLSVGKDDQLEFILGDCRSISLPEKADLAVCLYDVVGSFVHDEDNVAILRNIYRHLKAGGYLVLSVMNLELTESIAAYQVPVVAEHLDELAKLKPSKIMQKSGNIFDPEYFLLETKTGIVYRKEQFENLDDLSAEYVIRDKRYRRAEICDLLVKTGFHILDSFYVRAGQWEEALRATDPKAKEILVIAKKIAN